MDQLMDCINVSVQMSRKLLIKLHIEAKKIYVEKECDRYYGIDIESTKRKKVHQLMLGQESIEFYNEIYPQIGIKDTLIPNRDQRRNSLSSRDSKDSEFFM